MSTRQVELKSSTKNIQSSNNDEIANAYDHLTPPYYPIAYKAGKWFFCGLPFYVNEHVLVPRADTEILVEEVLKKAKFQSLNILDLCTGSGCIAVAIAKQAKAGTTVYASDVSADALKIAKRNASINKVKIKFFQSDLFDKILVHLFDCIVCNPPYIKTNEIGKYDKSILFEPRIALDGGEDGMEFYRQIIKCAANERRLAPNGYIFFEIGDKVQAEQVKTLLQHNGFCDIQIVKDRVVHARKIN